MKTITNNELEEKFQKVLTTPASFDFFVAIHDFVAYIESKSSLFRILAKPVKSNSEIDIPKKYGYLKQIYQGLEDADRQSDVDLGHARYAVILELNRIRKNDVSESNSFWKKRELFRKLVGEVYEVLHPTLA